MRRSRAYDIGLAAIVALASACTFTRTNSIHDPAAADEAGTAKLDAGASEGGTGGAVAVDPPVVPGDAFVTLNAAAAAHTELCANDGMHPNFPDDADRITRVFCQDVKGGVAAAPTSLADLLTVLGLNFANPTGENGTGGNPGFAILGHSSALTARKVSSLTPTAFVFTPPPTDGSKPSGYVFLAFDPGETFVEVASHDPTADSVNLYIVFFDKECSTASGGCGNADLLTPKLVTGWSNVRVYESETALNNTIADCKQCHAPDDTKPQMLRMQENTAPFTHWFSGTTDGGKALLADFHAAHGAGEDYGPIPAALIDKSDPAKMAAMIAAAGFATQPNAFPSSVVEAEVHTSAAGQPGVNVPSGKSATWQALYDQAVAGNFIATPYHDVKVTDPTKLTAMTTAYRAWQAGTSSSLPDVRDVFLDDGLPDMGFAAKPGLDGRGLLLQMCRQCHDSTLDQTISRAKFNVDQLDTMPRDEKNLAIERLQMGIDTRLRMPPALFRTVNAQDIALMVDELSK